MSRMWLLAGLICAGTTALFGQNQDLRDGYRVVFYNVENLFDTIDNADVQDSEFTPEADKKWNDWRYRTKVNRIGQVIVGIGEGQLPALVGLAEVENRGVLQDVVQSRVLERADYDLVHFDSPDRRGIDVALLYRPEVFSVVNSRAIPLRLADVPEFASRDLLYVKGVMGGKDTLHVFVNHWPSRYGGKEKSEHKRLAASALLQAVMDSICQNSPDPKILAMGDFNDHPSDSSLRRLEADGCSGLHNCMAVDLNYEGSHRYRGEWAYLDQILISRNLLADPSKRQKHGLRAGQARVYNHPELLEKDDRYPGEMPKRTYFGPTYHDGYSDHLPVYIDVNYK